MIIKSGDIFKEPSDALVVTTNRVVKHDGSLVMGAGIAAEFAKKDSMIPKKLGNKVTTLGNQCHLVFSSILEKYIISFPTKEHFKDPSPLWLIEKSTKELVELVNENQYIHTVSMPLPGCGLGGLDPRDVISVLEEYLDDRFTVLINRELR